MCLYACGTMIWKTGFRKQLALIEKTKDIVRCIKFNDKYRNEEHNVLIRIRQCFQRVLALDLTDSQ